MTLVLPMAVALISAGLARAEEAALPLGMAIGFECCVEVIVGSDESDPPPEDADEWEFDVVSTQMGTAPLAAGCDPPWIRVDPGGIQRWGQGAGPSGKPVYELNGAEATFAGGSEEDIWVRTGQVRPYSQGAVGRCWIRTRANTRTTVSVSPSAIPLMGGGRQIASRAWIGWQAAPSGPMYLDVRRAGVPRGTKNMWLYVTAERKGLEDAAGTYAGVVTVTIMAQ